MTLVYVTGAVSEGVRRKEEAGGDASAVAGVEAVSVAANATAVSGHRKVST